GCKLCKYIFVTASAVLNVANKPLKPLHRFHLQYTSLKRGVTETVYPSVHSHADRFARMLIPTQLIDRGLRRLADP
ncbi:MAG: hypothetical protein WBX14_07135, partial [Candidatus Udaeobacter sp.]